MTIIGNLMIFLVSSPFLHAADPAGTYRLADSAESLQAQKEAALEQTVAALNPLLRYPASIRLSTKPPQCEQYQIVPIPNGQSVQCDSHHPLQLEQGTERVHTTKEGEKLRVESQIEPEVIHFKLHSDTGTMVTEMKFSGAQLTVTKSVQSPQLPVPLVMTYNYRKVSP